MGALALRVLGALALALLAAICLLWIFGPREPVDLAARVDPAPIAADPAGYLAAQEATFFDITPGTEKRILWAGAPGARTDLSVLYVHGFSASSEEIRPVPDEVAAALGANLVFTRLAGHGRGGAAMAEPQLGDWMADMSEALAVARAVGERVLILSVSTGGTLTALALTQPDLAEDVMGAAFLSPNFGLHARSEFLLTLPGARWTVPLLIGQERGFAPHNAAQERYWTTRYPTVALLPMAAAARAARAASYERVTVPALFLFSEADLVVSPRETRKIAARWGAPAQVETLTLTEGDDPMSHIIAGDIMSPGSTAATTAAIVDWAQALGAR